MTALPTRIALRCYAEIKRTGLLEQPMMQKLFRRAYFLYKRHFEDPFHSLAKLRPELFSGGNILDVGANIGYTASIFSGAVSGGYQVFAFEPEPKNFDALVKLVAECGLERSVVPVHAAVGSSEGSIELHINEKHHGDHRIMTDDFKGRVSPQDASCTVPLVSLDGFCRSKGIENQISFIKIDVQGYEYNVLSGMQRVVELNPRVTVAFEYSEHDTRELGFDPREVLRFFSERKFHLYRLDQSGTLSVLDSSTLEDDQMRRSYIDLLASRDDLGR